MRIPHERVGETAVVGHLTGNGNGSGLVVLRADIDALPIQETNDVPYRSQTPGMMHACGHDAHTTCLLGAAKVLSAHLADFGGEVRFLFQPAEEIGQGARPLIAAGMLDGAQRVFGLHTASDLPAGTVGIKPGANNAGVDHFIIRIHGKSAHVSTPQLGVDALYIASELVVALQSIVTRMTSPVEPVLIGVGQAERRHGLQRRGRDRRARGHDAHVLAREPRAPSRNDQRRGPHTSPPFTAARQRSNGTTSPRRSRTTPVCAGRSSASPTCSGIPATANRALSLSGDDFAEYLLQTKGAYAYLGTANPKKPHTCISNHRGDFDIDEETLPLGAALYAAYALSVLDPQFAK